jgi:hypothetical protein
MTNLIDKAIHKNSKLSYEEIKHSLGDRQRAVLEAVEYLRVATDRDVLNYLCLNDMNQVRPRITELIKKGVVQEIGNVRCTTTDRQVRQIKILKEDKNQLKFNL